MTRDALGTVQRRALERALVDDADARRYFALAGTLDAARDDHPEGRPPARLPDADGVLPAALLSLAVVSHLDESTAVSVTGDPWTPGGTPRSAVERGARLALRWFDVPVERVAARAGLPEVVFSSPE